jgi:hypothetical protein
MPSSVMIQDRRGFFARSVTRASRASEPPSPRLSARMMMATYLMVTSTMIAQNTSDKTPRMFSGVTGIGWWPLKISFSA